MFVNKAETLFKYLPLTKKRTLETFGIQVRTYERWLDGSARPSPPSRSKLARMTDWMDTMWTNLCTYTGVDPIHPWIPQNDERD